MTICRMKITGLTKISFNLAMFLEIYGWMFLWTKCPHSLSSGWIVWLMVLTVCLRWVFWKNVLEKCDEFSQKASGTLTTRFVYDWRVKDHKSGKRMWMRRRRFVAREFAATKRQDTYSPATGTHTANMIPLIYLKMLQECSEAGVTAKLGAPHSYVYALGIYIYIYIYKIYIPPKRWICPPLD